MLSKISFVCTWFASSKLLAARTIELLCWKSQTSFWHRARASRNLLPIQVPSTYGFLNGFQCHICSKTDYYNLNILEKGPCIPNFLNISETRRSHRTAGPGHSGSTSTSGWRGHWRYGAAAFRKGKRAKQIDTSRKGWGKHIWVAQLVTSWYINILSLHIPTFAININHSKTRWWFQIFSIFNPTRGNDPFWLLFSRWVETTNQTCSSIFLWNQTTTAPVFFKALTPKAASLWFGLSSYTDVRSRQKATQNENFS